MKAITLERYGSPDVLRLQEIDKPVVHDDDVLVRIRAASLNPYDWHLLTGRPYIARAQFGLLKPKVNGLGADLAGQVEAVGKNVTQFRSGDEVFGEVNGEVPGQPLLELGSCSEYVCVSEDSVVPKPANLTFEQAAAVPMAAHTALQALRDRGRIEAGQRVLINGASGGVGPFAVQIAKSLGAEVTGVCSTRNVDMVRSIGADKVIDYTREDFTRGGQRYDLMLDNVGNRSLSECRRVLDPEAIYLSSFGQPENRWIGPVAELAKMFVVSPFVSQKMIPLTVKRTKEALLALKNLIEAGKVTPVIDRTYPLDEVPEAMRYLEEGHARGKIVITV
ncbi:NAD(P)-dependent alcohol dehydrogenase [Gemmatimonadota bacterium]